jgi:hypothetical protein
MKNFVSENTKIDFEKYALTYSTESKDELPDMVRIGSFERKTASVPVFLPLDFDELHGLHGLHGLCFETNSQTQGDVLRQMQYIALSLIKQVSQGLLRLSFVDIGLTTNFPLIHSLNLSNIHFIRDSEKLEQKMEGLFKTSQYISSECLRFDYPNLKEYNKANEYKEPYNILFISNFPKGFREEDINKVNMLVKEGMKCGIYVVMNLDKDYFPKINSYNPDHFVNLFSITKQMLHIDCTKPEIELTNLNVKVIRDQLVKNLFVFESYSQEELSRLIDAINQSFATQDNQYENFISIPIGRSGRQEICFEMGQKAQVNHGFIAGGNGTGKTTFLHNIITSIADRYSSDELRLFLMDFKGIDFNIYKDHPNVEFLLADRKGFKLGLAALSYLQEEMDKRQALFNEAGDNITIFPNTTKWQKRNCRAF